MASDVAVPGQDPLQAFRESIIAKMKDMVPLALPEDVLKNLFDRAIEEQFFKRREVRDSYGRVESSKVSWFEEAVILAATPFLKEKVAIFVKDNQHILDTALKNFASENNLLLLAMAAMRGAQRQDIMELAVAIVQTMKRGY